MHRCIRASCGSWLGPRLLNVVTSNRSCQPYAICRRACSGRIVVPRDQLETKFVRSSGPGGQNVNKVSTKAEVRFRLDDAYWMPPDVRQRLAAQQRKRVSKSGWIVLQSDATRSQRCNLQDCISRLQTMVDQAAVKPKERKLWVGESVAGKAKRVAQKRHRRENKRQFGRRVHDRDDW